MLSSRSSPLKPKSWEKEQPSYVLCFQKDSKTLILPDFNYHGPQNSLSLFILTFYNPDEKDPLLLAFSMCCFWFSVAEVFRWGCFKRLHANWRALKLWWDITRSWSDGGKRRVQASGASFSLKKKFKKQKPLKETNSIWKQARCVQGRGWISLHVGNRYQFIYNPDA